MHLGAQTAATLFWLVVLAFFIAVVMLWAAWPFFTRCRDTRQRNRAIAARRREQTLRGNWK